MITSHGPLCDVCGNYIIPFENERVNFFKVAQIESPSALCCHNKCKDAVLNCAGDWQKLPEGPLRKLYEKVVI